MSVPFLDLVRLHESIRPELDAAFERVVGSAAFVGGSEVAAFEEEFGAAHEAPPGASCGSGTDALALALRAHGVGAGDEVIVPSMTFVATAEAVVHVGATPVVADVDPVTLLLGAEQVEAVRTDRTRAVIPVHLYGHVVPFEDLRAWRDSGLVVIEDAAQAHVATWRGEPVGTVGHAVCFSFYPGKNLGALGDGGMVLSRDPDAVAEVRRLRDHGRTSKFEHQVPGYCSRLDGLQAAFLRVKLPHLADWTEGRRRAADRYRSGLDGHLVPWEDGAVHHLLVARVPDPQATQVALRGAGVATGLHYPVPLSRQPWLVPFAGEGAPSSEQAAEEILSLPMDPLMTETEVDLVVKALVAALRSTG